MLRFKDKLFQWNWIPEPLYPWYQKSDVSLTFKLKSYPGEDIPVLGQMEVMVKYNQQEETLPLLVVKGDVRSLFGRNWFSHITLD